MRNYIDNLTDDELYFVCSRIGGRNLRDLYQKNGSRFNKYKPGFRPSSLSNEEAYNFACTNRGVSFVASFINMFIDSWLREINESKKAAIRNGDSELTSVVKTLTESVFDEKPYLYFKLAEYELSAEPTELLCYTVKLEAKNKALSSAAEDIKRLEEIRETLSQKYAEELRAQKEKYGIAIKEAEQEVEDLKLSAEQAKARIDSLESSRDALEAELKTYREMSAHVENSEILHPAPGYLYSSLCLTYQDNLDKDRILRAADIRENEFSEDFIESAPDYKRLYNNDGPKQIGTLGVWDWKVLPNRSDPTKIFLDVAFNSHIKPIEVVVVKDCVNVTQLVENLKSGIHADVHSARVLISYTEDDKYVGIICDENVLQTRQSVLVLKNDVLKLPVYSFFKDDTLIVEQIIVLKKILPGMPTELIRVKEPLDIVRESIIARATWPVLQQRGFIRNEYRQIKTFLQDLQITDLYEEISEKCDCTIAEATEYVNHFMVLADNAALGNTVENAAMVQIIRNDIEVYSACKKEIRKEWEQENELLLKASDDKLAAADKALEVSKASVQLKKRELSELQKQIDEIDKELMQKDELADEIEKLVAQKIESARNNAADFIASNMLANAYGRASSGWSSQKEIAEKPDTSLFIGQMPIKSDDPDEHDTYRQLLNTVQLELEEAGVNKTDTVGLSALLYSAYLRRIPILLAGPNGMDIADAFSAAFECKTAARFFCRGADTSSISVCATSEADIVVIDNPLQGNWEHSVVQLVSKREKFYILTQPFSEDLLLEPHSLFNYCFPVITDLFVSSIPTREFIGGRLSSQFRHFSPSKTDASYNKFLNEIRGSALIRENIRSLITDINSFDDKQPQDTILTMLLYPLMYALGKPRVLVDRIDLLAEKPSAHTMQKIIDLIGEEE